MAPGTALVDVNRSEGSTKMAAESGHGNVTVETETLKRWLVVAGVLLGAFGSSLLGVVGWMALTVHDLSVDFSAMKAEMDTVKPRDILDALHASEKDRITIKDVEAVVSRSAPWVVERSEWKQWRDGIDQRIRLLESKL